MRSRLKISRAGIELIESFEGLRRKAARLPDGRWTIGYGHTLSAREGAEVSAEDAEALLLFDLLPVTEAVDGLVFVELTQNQFDALCAFAFNVGVDAFRSSDVLKRVNEGRLTEAACAFDLWRKAEIAGEEMVLDALIRRRAAEKALFLAPADGVVPTPSPLVRPAHDPALAATLPQRRPAHIETPLDGAEAIVRRVGPVEAPEPQPAAAEPELVVIEPAPSAAVEATPFEQELEVVELAEPGAEPLTPSPPEPAEAPAEAPSFVEAAPAPAEQELAALVTEEPGTEAIAPAEAAPAVEPEPEPIPPAEQELAALEATEPGVEAVAPVETPVMAEPTAPEPVEAQPVAAEAPALIEPAPGPVAEPTPPPAPAVNVAAAAAMSARLFAPYGGGVGFGALPPRPQLTEVEGAPVAAPAPTPGVGESAPARPEAPVQPEPAVASEPPAFALTPPPEREPTFMPQPASVVWSQPQPEPAEETPLFEETWEEVRPAPRIIRHEPVETDLADEEAGPSGPFILLGVIGLFAFGGAVAAFLKAKQVTTPEPAILAWVLALIAVACVSTSVYFLLKRLGGVRD